MVEVQWPSESPKSSSSLIYVVCLVRKQLHAMYTHHIEFEEEGRWDLGKRADWRGVFGSQMPLYLYGCQQAVPLREWVGGMFPAGLLPKGGGDLLSHPVKVSLRYFDTHIYTHTRTYCKVSTGKLWAIMRRHLRADGCIAQTNWDTVRLW